MNENLNKTTNEYQKNETAQALPKYSIVLRFWSTPQEIEVTDIISCQNKYTKAYYYKFVDSTGRLWDNVPESDVIVIKNFPDKEDIDDFMRLRRETDELQNKLRNIRQDNMDVSVG